MSLLSRIRNVFAQGRVRRELDEELADHVEEAVRAGRSRAEAERALGSALRHRESSMDIKMAGWLEALRADLVFGYRQLRQRPAVTGAAILSLALAIGAVTTAFRLTDAVLLRPLPVADPGSLFVVAVEDVDEFTGEVHSSEGFAYPLFVEMREALKDTAEMLVVGYAGRNDITYGSDEEMEKAQRQYVSGTAFGLFGLPPAAGRLLTAADDQRPNGHPVAVISYDYWTRRFGRDPGAVGRTFREGMTVYEIVGVAPAGFTGTETGTMTEYFIPAMQNGEAIGRADWHWMRVWARVRPGASEEGVRQRLQATLTAHRKERAKGFSANTPLVRRERFENARLTMRSAAAGVSGLQRNYRQPLLILGAVVLLVLFIACANMANLLTAQTAARSKEMALRVAIGAGRGRLIQLLLVECLLLAAAATVGGLALAGWWTPLVVGMINPVDNPVRLSLPWDWRVGGFAALLAVGVTVLFGMGPAWRASALQPMVAMKGGDDPRRRRRGMQALLAVQVAFCLVVHFMAGLFVGTFERLAAQPTGFATERILLLETGVKGAGATAKRPAAEWEEVARRLRETPGVERVARSSWALLSGNAWTSTVMLPNRPVDPQASHFLSVSPGWLETMEIGMTAGRDFRPGEVAPHLDEKKRPVEGVVIVNEAFARRHFNGENPVGRSFVTLEGDNVPVQNRIVGFVRDARYRRMRDEMPPTVYVPMGAEQWATLAVKTAGEPGGLATVLRQTVAAAGQGFRVMNVRTQAELLSNQLIRERLLAMLSVFFAGVALMLAAVGLYGVLHYAVLQRRREIGIRLALGARTGQIARHVGGELVAVLVVGAAAGLGMGWASERFVTSLLFAVSGQDWMVWAAPLGALLVAALVAAWPPLLAAVRTDPAEALRSE
jgi:putative ABC transport system permease protein